MPVIISNNLIGKIPLMDSSVIRVNLAWIDNFLVARRILDESHYQIYLDYPDGRKKPPQPKISITEAIQLAGHPKVRYFAISNAENIEKLSSIKSQINCELVPKIETARGHFNEYILVDDGSDEPIICPEGFTLLRTDHLGLALARNLAVKESTGDIICLLDDDDEFFSDRLDLMKQFVRDNYDKADIFSHDYMVFGDIPEQIIKMGHNPDKILDLNQFVGTSWYKRGVWDTLGGYNDAAIEDWDFWARAIKAGKKFIVSPFIIYHYRLRKGSLSYEMNDYNGEVFKKVRADIIKRYYA